jgi:predicted nucleic acid-binding protein
VTDVVCDTSIVLKWFHEAGEAEVPEARSLLGGHRDGRITAWILDLTLYEVGNVLLRSLRWPAEEVAAQLDDLRAICAPLAPSDHELRLAVRLADAHELTVYDAAYAAVAQARGMAFATADVALLERGTGERAGDIASRLGLAPAA